MPGSVLQLRRETYLRLISEAVIDPSVTHLVLDKTNLDRRNVKVGSYVSEPLSSSLTGCRCRTM
jgi:hypothetical protein